MKIELTNEQVSILNMAILTRARLIENLLHTWKTGVITGETDYLVEVYSKELKSVNELGLIIK